MRTAIVILTAAISLTACGKSNGQADKLDRAASQSDPAAAAELRNQADAIRDKGADGELGTPGSSAQNALQAAGDVAATNLASTAQPSQTPIDNQTGLTHAR